MPEYLAPGVYVEETSYRSKSIEGQSTTTAALIGPTRYGPVDLENVLITSLEEFEHTYGDGQALDFSDVPDMTNFVWHGARAFFLEGGKRLYVSRVFRGDGDDGIAHASLPSSSSPLGPNLSIRARYPGAVGGVRVRLTLRVSDNIVGVVKGPTGTTSLSFKPLRNRDVVLIRDVASPISSPPGMLGDFYLATWDQQNKTWLFTHRGGSQLSAFDQADGFDVRIVSATVSVDWVNGTRPSLVWAGLALDPDHQTSGIQDSVSSMFGVFSDNPERNREKPVVIELGGSSNDLAGLDLLNVLLDADEAAASPPRAPTLVERLGNLKSTDEERSVEVLLEGGHDGERPTATEYEGTADLDSSKKTGLRQFEDIEEISIVAAPGSTFGMQVGSAGDDATAIIRLLINHAQLMRYRIAILDSGNSQSISAVRKLRATLDSSYAALYFPWIRSLDPIRGVPIYLPPSGAVAGIYARNDINRAVYKAPANEVVNIANGFELNINKAQQDILNPEGINCFRYFEGRGFRLLGARTVTSDPEWKYVNLRRYFAYLEHSVDKGTQWAVFEPNGERLWQNVRRTIEDFLLNEWQSGALLGDRPEKAYFVKCDRSTMTQNDLDNGRMVALVGVAALRPAEFVIFRIGQWTAKA
jgi:hypothetical protein